MSPALQLTRVTTAFAAAANAWFVILWTRAAGPILEPGFRQLHEAPLWLLLTGGAVNAVGLFAFGTALNDVLDYRRDQRLNPDRPLASGTLRLDAAVTVVVVTFATAVLGATVLGMPTVLLTVTLAGAALIFNAAGKYVPAFGLILLGLLYAGQMSAPNLNLHFVWPVWLVMSHALAVAGLRHALSGRAPAISRRAIAFSVAGWAFWTSVIIVTGWWRNHPADAEGWTGAWAGMWPAWVNPRAAIGPVVLSIAFAVWAWRRAVTLGPGPRAAEKIARYGALWMALYACAWLLGQGFNAEALVLGLLALAGFMGMTVLREAFVLLEQPVRYRH